MVVFFLPIFMVLTIYEFIMYKLTWMYDLQYILNRHQMLLLSAVNIFLANHCKMDKIFINLLIERNLLTTSNHTGLVLFLAISQIFVHIVIYMTYYVFRCNSNHSLSVGKENLSRNSIIKAHMAHFPMS